MADFGSMTYIGAVSNIISRADGYQPLIGTKGYSYEYFSVNILGVDKDKGPLSNDLFPKTLPVPPSPGTSLTTYYVMRGRDVDCGSLTYRTWTVQNAPDITGAQYAGPKCGASALAEIIVIQKYSS